MKACLNVVLYISVHIICLELSNWTDMDRRTWMFGRPFRTRTDGHTCLSVLFRRTFVCKKFLPIFLNLLGVLGNLCEANVSNQDSRWIGKNGGHEHTGECKRKRLHARSRVPTGLRSCIDVWGRAQMGTGHVQTTPKTQKTLEGHISPKTCPNRTFEVFFGI